MSRARLTDLSESAFARGHPFIWLSFHLNSGAILDSIYSRYSKRYVWYFCYPRVIQIESFVTLDCQRTEFASVQVPDVFPTLETVYR